MKQIIATAIFFAGILTAGSALAQNHAVEATIPFDFTVGSKLLPSGTYRIISDTPNILEIQNRKLSTTVMSSAYGSAKESKVGKLVFHKYGDQYFLSEVVCSSADMSLEIPTSKLEKRARLQQASLRNADQTVVALK